MDNNITELLGKVVADLQQVMAANRGGIIIAIYVPPVPEMSMPVPVLDPVVRKNSLDDLLDELGANASAS